MRTKILIMLISFSICLAGCVLPFDPILRYSGEHTEYIAASIYSLPGVESAIDDEIMVLDTDLFGRTMVAVCLDRDIVLIDSKRSYPWKVFAVLIIQRIDDTHVYFYGERNYRMTKIDGTIELSRQVVEDTFNMEMLEELKNENDWNIPPEETTVALVKVPIQVEKNQTMSKLQEKALKEYVGNNFQSEFLRQDKEGRQLYFIVQIDNQTPVVYTWYAAIFEPDGSLCGGNAGVTPIHSISTIQLELARFLEQHCWVDAS